jgi:hypothetical protein
MEVKVLTQEELIQLRELNQEHIDIVIELGDIEINKNDLKNRKLQVIQQYNEYKLKEMMISKKLTEKYGDGNISLETGEIT